MRWGQWYVAMRVETVVRCNEGGDSGTLQRGWRQWYVAMRVVTVVCCHEGGDSGKLLRMSSQSMQ